MSLEPEPHAPLAIRPMRPGDALDVCRLIEQLTSRPITEADMLSRVEWAARSPFDSLYVAELDGAVCGFLAFRLREMIERPGRYGEIYALVTDSNVRRRGVGHALMDFAEQLARDQGCIGTWLVSGFKRKDEAHLFYEALGYEITGYRFVKLFDD